MQKEHYVRFASENVAELAGNAFRVLGTPPSQLLGYWKGILHPPSAELGRRVWGPWPRLWVKAAPVGGSLRMVLWFSNEHRRGLRAATVRTGVTHGKSLFQKEVQKRIDALA